MKCIYCGTESNLAVCTTCLDAKRILATGVDSQGMAIDGTHMTDGHGPALPGPVAGERIMYLILKGWSPPGGNIPLGYKCSVCGHNEFERE